VGDHKVSEIVKRLELLGQGIQHSASPGMWNQIFAAMSSSYTYGLRDVGADALSRAVDDLRSGTVEGYHVTMPFKNWAFEISELREPDVRRTGVANCLTMENGLISATNTDVAAARILLQELPAPPDRVLVIGAGATGTSLALACSEVAREVFVTNRTPRRAEQMAEYQRPNPIHVVEWQEREACASGVDLIVNATSCGLTTSDSPLRCWTAAGAVLYDLVYRPKPTALQIQAAKAAAPIVDGLAHLQAHAEASIPRLGLTMPTGEVPDESDEPGGRTRATSLGSAHHGGTGRRLGSFGNAEHRRREVRAVA
jgi:shikimate dehydrogenase